MQHFGKLLSIFMTFTDNSFSSVKANAFDGDTPYSDRHAIMHSSNILFANPDILHHSILPNHTQFGGFFKRLRFVVLDEVHIYHGVFGIHVAMVIRRLRRICNFYGNGDLQIICCSATIGNVKCILITNDT